MEEYSEIDRSRLLPLYILRTGIKDPQYPIVRNQGYPAWQLAICFKGEGRFVCGGHVHEIKKGDVFMFGPRVPHEYFSAGGDWGIHFFAFSGDAVPGIEAYLGVNDYMVISLPSEAVYDECIQLSHKIHRSFESDKSREIASSSLLYALISKVGVCVNDMNIKHGEVRNDSFSYTSPVIEYMRNNFKEQITLEDMAQVIGVSKSYLCRMFKNAYGTTPVRVLINIRLEQARRLLSSTDIKIKQLSEECGFCDTSYFCAVFKRAEGMTPEEYRRLQTE